MLTEANSKIKEIHRPKALNVNEHKSIAFNQPSFPWFDIVFLDWLVFIKSSRRSKKECYCRTSI